MRHCDQIDERDNVYVEMMKKLINWGGFTDTSLIESKTKGCIENLGEEITMENIMMVVGIQTKDTHTNHMELEKIGVI